MMTRWLLTVSLIVCWVWGCSEPEPGTTVDDPVEGDSTFESADPSWRPEDDYGGEGGAVDADADTDGDADASSDEGESGGAERAIEEADIIKLEGDVLYALSEYRGLVVIDVSDPSDLEVLGRYPTHGRPFEMYVREGVAYAIYSSFWIFEYDEATDTYDWVSTSRIVALDVTNPSDIQPLGTFDLAGEISDSRIVGDILYAVAFENGWCWRCDSTPRTTITSIAVGDPSSIHLVERLSYDEEGSWGWRRSISVTTERMYVAGVEYSSDWETSHSTIQVVDISSPTGQLEVGAEVEVAGQIESRWQMDEHEGVLRVVSQPGSGWGSNEQPVVETFEVLSSSDIEPLGRLDMVLPRPENLMSVRFDGERAYAVTFERTDPLFVIDLTDPANPLQRGELEIPGWLYHMEPRGDRLFAIGFDDTGDTSMAVSLFDVSDMDAPVQLDRVNFGGQWGWMPEDQDRIHKAFRILDEQGLILMPFSGWTRDDEGYYGHYVSGIQIIDFTLDDLTMRAVAPHHGSARRAFIHRDRLFAMSDERLESFDISDRDQPELLSSLVMSRSVYRVAPIGDTHVAELVSDWWTGEARLDILPMSDPDGMEPVGSLDLVELLPDREDRPYYYWYYGFSYSYSRLFSNGDYVYLVWGERTCYWYWDEGCEREELTGVAVFDVSDPASPEMVSTARFPIAFPYQRGWWWRGTVEAGETMVLVGSTLVMRPSNDYYYWYDEDPGAPTLEIIDFSSPAEPAHSASFSIPGEHEMGTLQVSNGHVLTSHSEPVEGAEGRVRFYMDVIDVSDPAAPEVAHEINIPGSPISFDPETGRLVTVDYQRTEERVSDWSDCGYYDYSAWDGDERICFRVWRSLNLLDVDDGRAVLLDRHGFGERRLRDVRVTPERIFVGMESQRYWWDDGSDVDPRPELITMTGVDGAELQERSSVRMRSPYSWLYAARGDRAIVLSDTPPALDVIDAGDADDPVTAQQTMLTGYGYDVHLLGDSVLSANSMWGVQVIPLH